MYIMQPQTLNPVRLTLRLLSTLPSKTTATTTTTTTRTLPSHFRRHHKYYYHHYSTQRSTDSSIHAFPHPTKPSYHLLTLLPTDPPNPSLCIGSSPSLPPDPRSFEANPRFLGIVHSVLAVHAVDDPTVRADIDAASYGNKIGGGGSSSSSSSSSSRSSNRSGGWVHIGDQRRLPEYGRIPDPDDIFGSVEVDGHGRLVDGHGNYQESGTYRIVTRDGILGLSPYLKEKLVERLKELDAQELGDQDKNNNHP